MQHHAQICTLTDIVPRMKTLVNGLTSGGSDYVIHQGTYLPATGIQSQQNVLQSNHQYSHMLNTGTKDNVYNALSAGNTTQYNATAIQRDSQLAIVSRILRSVVNGPHNSDFNSQTFVSAVNSMKDIQSSLQYSLSLDDGNIFSSNTSSRKISSTNVNIPPPSMSGKGMYNMIPDLPNTQIPPPMIANNGIHTYGFCDNGLHGGSLTDLPFGLHGLLKNGLQNNGLTHNALQYGIQYGLHKNSLHLTCHNNQHIPHKKSKINLDRYGGKEVYTPPGYNPRQPPPQIGQKRSYEQMMQSSTCQQSTPFITNTTNRLSGTNGLVNPKTNGPNFHATQMSNRTSSLNCTLCNVTCLDIETFEIHKQSKQHLCRASGQTTDALIDRFNKTAQSESTEPFCKICNRRYSGTLLNHQKGPEHKRKDRLTRRGCVLCQTGPYTTYPEYVKHIDSAEHKQQKDALQSEMKERESLGIAVNPAYISKPGPIKASQILQDALQKSAAPVVTLKQNGITFHPPKSVSSNLMSPKPTSSIVFNGSAVASTSINVPALATASMSASGIGLISDNVPGGVTNQTMSRINPVGHSRLSDIYGRNMISTAVQQGYANANVRAVSTSHSSPTSPNKHITTTFSTTSPGDTNGITLTSANPVGLSLTTRYPSPENCLNPESYKASSKSLSFDNDVSIAKPFHQHDVVPNKDSCTGSPDKLITVDKVGTCEDQDDVIPSGYQAEQCKSNTDDGLKCSRNSKTNDKDNTEHNESMGVSRESELSMQCDGKNGTTDNGRNFVVPVQGYFCSLCDVFYLDGDTPHCKSQTHIDMIRKMQCNGSTNSTERSMSSVRNWIHKQLVHKEQPITEPLNCALDRTEMVEVQKAASIPAEGVVISDETMCSESRTDTSKHCHTKNTCLITENQDASLDPELSAISDNIITQD